QRAFTTGWYDRSSQQLRRRSGAPRRPAAPAVDQVRRPPFRRSDRGSLQPVRSRQLRVVYVAGKQPALWAAKFELEPRLRAADIAARIQGHFLDPVVLSRRWGPALAGPPRRTRPLSIWNADCGATLSCAPSRSARTKDGWLICRRDDF